MVNPKTRVLDIKKVIMESVKNDAAERSNRKKKTDTETVEQRNTMAQHARNPEPSDGLGNIGNTQ